MRRWFKKLGGGKGGSEGDPPSAEPEEGLDRTTMVSRSDIVRAANPPVANLDVLEGPEGLGTRRFRVSEGQNTVGRSPDCDISLPDPAISRVHAVLIADEAGIVIEHHSQTNETLVNGDPVADRRPLAHGDQVQLADRVVLRVDAPALKKDTRAGTLRGAMEARVDLDRRIEEDFVREGSFLDVDVVDSYGMKQRETRHDRVVVSFERFRAYIERQVQGRQGRVLNSNGDEVMAYFESADAALGSARDLVAGLGEFNADQNLLGDGFKIRVGIHSGRSAVDLESGIAYSPVLDGAGHLQKEAAIDGVLVSQETYDGLTDRGGLTSVGAAGKRGIEAWAVDAGGDS